MTLPEKVRILMDKGVRITAPFSVEIGEEVSLERVSGEGVILYSGTKIYGAKTLISPGVTIGYETPATVVDCCIGSGASLKGGFFQASVFLEGTSIASGAQVREGSLLEEGVKAGHTVGLKQTLLFPFVALGSLINLCDCLMAGGTSREDHSEVGSSYIHFNYTPQQDKATPSLIGDVTRGVMLNQPPIFLGGQGGLVGPLRIDYGTVITAGTIWRHDSVGAKLLHGGGGKKLSQDYRAQSYGDIRRKVSNNILYIANILALRQWYIHVRRPFFLRQELGQELFAGSMECLDRMVGERLIQFREFSRNLRSSLADQEQAGRRDGDIFRQHRELAERWPTMEACFATPFSGAGINCDAFLTLLEKAALLQGNTGYIGVIQSLDEEARNAGTAWLTEIVDDIARRAWACLPAFSTYVT